MTITLTTNDVRADAGDMLKMLAAFAGASVYVPAPGAGTPPPEVTSGDPNFPADPTQAPLPSPDNSAMLLFNGKITGRPYLRDKDGSIWTLQVAPNPDPSASPRGDAMRNGSRVVPADPTWSYNQLIVRGGQVWAILAQGQSQYFNPSTGAMYNGNAPDAVVPGAPPPTPPVIVSPKPWTNAHGIVVRPGTSGATILCGNGQTLPNLSAAIAVAQEGDTVLLTNGEYHDAPPAWTVPLLIDLGNSTFRDVDTASLARGKGLFVPCADSIIQHGTILGVAADQTEGQLTSAIRPDEGCGYLEIIGIVAHDNQCAVGHGGFPIEIHIEDSDLSNNGLKVNNGDLTHDIYVGKGCTLLELDNVICDGANEGHAVKFRGAELIVNGGTFASAPGKPFDLPNGSAVPFNINKATIIKEPDDADHGILAYGEEGAQPGSTGGFITDGTIIALCDNPLITGPVGTVDASGVTMTGNKITPSGAIVLVGF